MDPDRATKVVVQTARENIRHAVDGAMHVFATGRGRELPNPFTKTKTSEEYVSDSRRIVAERLKSAGLKTDRQFMEALREVIKEVAVQPVFGLFSAFDGEGAYAEDIWIELHAKGVGPIPSHFHEILQPIEEDLLSGPAEA
jgi:hypothetical protein